MGKGKHAKHAVFLKIFKFHLGNQKFKHLKSETILLNFASLG